MNIISKKSSIFIKSNFEISKHLIKIGTETIDLVQQYKYLDILRDEYLNYTCTFVNMYGNKAFGYNKFDKCDKIQYRAIISTLHGDKSIKRSFYCRIERAHVTKTKKEY